MGKIEASHTVEIDAPRDHVYAIAADIARCDEWTPSVESVVVIESGADGSVTRVEMENDAVVKRTTTVLRYSYGPPARISWEQEKGDAKSLVGDWMIEEIADGRTRATYSLIADPGRVLGLLLRGPVEGKVKEFLTRGAAEGLKERAESEPA